MRLLWTAQSVAVTQPQPGRMRAPEYCGNISSTVELRVRVLSTTV